MSLLSLLKKSKLNPDQEAAFKILQSRSNVFLTGAAGTGKSFVVRRYLETKSAPPPILASTGAAAVLVGGRTFHSFFGLGILEGGVEKTVKKAVESYRVRSRLKKTHEIVVDEISMIHPQAFEAADRIARTVKGNTTPFGGIRLILTGDFFQLPPVDPHKKEVAFLFDTEEWQNLDLKIYELTEPMRAKDEAFLSILQKVRFGNCDEEVAEFLDSKTAPLTQDFLGTVLFPRKEKVESYNQERLEKIKAAAHTFETEIQISPKTNFDRERALKLAPLPEVLILKEGALVMIRKNDPDGAFVNGSLGTIEKIKSDHLKVTLLSGEEVAVERDDFQILDADGAVVCTVRNFPVTLGWASTIHKAQGASIDRVHLDLKNLWEGGQGYVALSRARDPKQLFVSEWTANSFKANPRVVEFYRALSLSGE